MNPLLENFFKRPGVDIVISDSNSSGNSYTKNDPQFNVWLESLEENKDYQVGNKVVSLYPNSSKIKRILNINVNETVKNLNTSYLNVSSFYVNGNVLENLTIGNIIKELVIAGGTISNLTLKGKLNGDFIVTTNVSVCSVNVQAPDVFALSGVTVDFGPGNFNPNTTTNTLFLSSLLSLPGSRLAVPEAIISKINNPELRDKLLGIIAQPIPIPIVPPDSYYYSYYYNEDDLIGALPDGEVKYFINAVSENWGDLGNWFEDAEGLIPCLDLPNFDLGESVIIPANTTTLYGGSLILGNNSLVFGTIRAQSVEFKGNSELRPGASITVYGGLITFSENSCQRAEQGGNFLFKGTASNRGIIYGSATFEGNSSNFGSLYGTATFKDYAANRGIVYFQTAFYNAAANLGSLIHNSTFYDYAINSGSVGGNAVFDGIGFNEEEHSSLSNSGVFYNRTSRYGSFFGGCTNAGSVGNTLTFRTSAINIGTSQNDVYCFDNTRLYGIITAPNKKLFLYDHSRFYQGDNSYIRLENPDSIYQFVSDINELSAAIVNQANPPYNLFNPFLSTIELNNITIYGGISAQQITLTNCNVAQRSLLIGNVTFNTEGIYNTRSLFMQSDLTKGNKGEIRGNATFNGYSYNYRSHYEYNGAGITSYPTQAQNLPGNVRDYRGGWITGTATFNDTSVNGGAINGNAIFNNTGKNFFEFDYYGNVIVRNGLVKGTATFNDFTSFQVNKGTVEGLSAVNNLPSFYTLPLSGLEVVYSPVGNIVADTLDEYGAGVYYFQSGCGSCLTLEIDINLGKLKITGAMTVPAGGPFVCDIPTDSMIPLTGWYSPSDPTNVFDLQGSGNIVLLKNENSL